MPLDFNELCQILETITHSDITELTLKTNDFELTVRKAVAVSNQLLPGSHLGQQGTVGLGLTSTSGAGTSVAQDTGVEVVTRRVAEHTGIAAQTPSPVAAPLPIEQKFLEVFSPMVGTFYRAPAPGEQPFVEVGDRIRVGQTVCIIEAMKLMNEIEAEVSGQVLEILAQNGEPVEYGQPLMRIKPE